MPNTVEKIAVVGQGVCGLSVAEVLLQRGFDVEIFSRDDLASTASMSAGAYWWPHKIYPQERVIKWALDTFKYYESLASDKSSGVFFSQHNRFCVVPDEGEYVASLLHDRVEIESPSEVGPCVSAAKMTLPTIDVPTFMPYLRSKVEAAGAKFTIRKLTSLDGLFVNFDTVVNCSGLGARELAQDCEMYPIYGHTISVEKPSGLEVSTRVVDDYTNLTLILPRLEDCLLGGTSERARGPQEADEQKFKALFERCVKVVPELRNVKIRKQAVGVRPGRGEIRLEVERFSNAKTLIHNYGHAGGGYTVGYGCALEVAELVQSSFSCAVDSA